MAGGRGRRTGGEVRVKNMLCSEEGWTFLETLIVIAVIVTLSGSVGMAGLKFVTESKRVAARTQIETYAAAINAYAMDAGRIPTEAQGLEALRRKPVLEPVPRRWNGPYVTREIADDPWGRPYEYRIPGPEGLPFGLLSYGADGRPGGTKGAADVRSWSRE